MEAKTRFENNIDSIRIIDKYFDNNNCYKLQIGCGDNILEGWLNTDLNSLKKLNVAHLDAGKTFPFADNTFDFIFSEHIFEHLTFEQGLIMLSESYRTLKTGGFFRIAVPDLDFLAKLYLYKSFPIHTEYIQWSANTFCANISKHIQDPNLLSVYVINNFFKDWGHQIIHNHETLSDLLLRSGFEEIRKERVGTSQIPELRNLEKHGTKIPAEFNELETLVLEAMK